MKLLFVPSLPLPCYCVSLTPVYPPQQPILKHPQPLFLPKCEISSLIPILNRKSYGSVNFTLYIFG